MANNISGPKLSLAELWANANPASKLRVQLFIFALIILAAGAGFFSHAEFFGSGTTAKSINTDSLQRVNKKLAMKTDSLKVLITRIAESTMPDSITGLGKDTSRTKATFLQYLREYQIAEDEAMANPRSREKAFMRELTAYELAWFIKEMRYHRNDAVVQNYLLGYYGGGMVQFPKEPGQYPIPKKIIFMIQP